MSIANMVSRCHSSVDPDFGSGLPTDVKRITVRLNINEADDESDDSSGGDESSDGDTEPALRVGGLVCWVVRAFTSFLRCFVSCFCFPFVGSSLPALRGERRCWL